MFSERESVFTYCAGANFVCDNALSGCDIVLFACEKAFSYCDIEFCACASALSGCAIVFPSCDAALSVCDGVFSGERGVLVVFVPELHSGLLVFNPKGVLRCVIGRVSEMLITSSV